MNRTPPRPDSGFSLIELLVVIGIIALLIGILLPVLGRVREAGKAAVCMSNMRQLATATNSYMLDSNRYLPQPAEDGGIPVVQDRRDALWFNALDYYLKQTTTSGTAATRSYDIYKQDPVWQDLPVTVNGGTVLEEDDVRSIKMNEYFGHITTSTNPNAPGVPSPAFKFFKITDIPLPSNTVMYGDGRAFDTPAVNTGTVDVIGTRSFNMREAVVGLRHDEGINAVMADASVKYATSPIKTSTGANQYQGWYDNDDPVVQNRPDVTFNFRPEDFAP